MSLKLTRVGGASLRCDPRQEGDDLLGGLHGPRRRIVVDGIPAAVAVSGPRRTSWRTS
ncbi:hypothetical protein EDC02_3474 [Micromonospora sp. Llam0]|uniref:hypothetical protein n=1 Tax=Micromonospora sp. Llam0 TaxID=2485143 RepID=UPI000FAF4301|nr:hypothetical protein [Micromonospora sp. Llam0]ROO61534.1 hypothetical protein EDC02_3474 [Micromonospora sp. Llam0]